MKIFIRRIVKPEVTPEQVEEVVEPFIETHIVDPTPHPAYDDMPSLVAFFENGLA